MKEVLNYFFSPFVRPKFNFYFGKTAVGVPYFFPRKAIKDPDKPGYLKFVTKKVGFDFCRLGWKTKWQETDYRFEWSPVFSFVFFGYQFAITVDQEHLDHYWESWLYYHNSTDKSLPTVDRVKDCIENFPQTYTVTKNGKSEFIDYYQLILKKKWRPLSKSEKRDKIIESVI